MRTFVTIIFTNHTVEDSTACTYSSFYMHVFISIFEGNGSAMTWGTCPHGYLQCARVCLSAVASFKTQHTTEMCAARGQIWAINETRL